MPSSLTHSVALALLDWQNSTFCLPLIKLTLNGSLDLRAPSIMDRLPNELLSVIFTFAVEHCHDLSDLTISPTTLSHICRRWRQISLSTGALWTNIVLTFPTSVHQLVGTETWLAHSKTYPLDILLDFRDPAWDWEENWHDFNRKDMEDVLLLLLPHVARWRSFELLSDTWAPIFTFLWNTRAVKSAGMLKTLSLSRCNEFFASKGEIFQPASLRQHLPLFGGGGLANLREVNLTGVHVDWSTAALANLAKLELKYHASDVMPSVDQFLHILAACPGLQALSIIGWGPQFDPADNASHSTSASPDLAAMKGAIRLPYLVQFAFGFVDVYYAVKLLALFDLPALEELSLEDVSNSLHLPNPDDGTVLLDWLAALPEHDPESAADGTSSRSTSNTNIPLAQLRTLEVKSLHARLPTFLRFFHACTDLSALSISDVNDAALVALAPPYNNNSTALVDDLLPCPFVHKISGRSVDAVLFARIVAGRPLLAEVAFEETPEVTYYAELDSNSTSDAEP
ncbi:hypothetical protein C8J57DRAFT_107871 [Mycena rebaudengoi]|nr:hypothetical protein C8J57DRAFT_107871 [Mycena rebaudengoi]